MNATKPGKPTARPATGATKRAGKMAGSDAAGSEQELAVAGAIHLLALQAISTWRRWAPGDLTFQGGTSLHLAFGSTRYSEDLDFLIRPDAAKDLPGLAGRCAQQVREGLMRFYPDAKVDISLGKDESNPRLFWIGMTSSRFARKVKVKVEFFATQYAQQYRSSLRPVSARDANVSRLVSTASLLPVATLDEVLLDKVHAIAMRSYAKARDFYDVWYLSTQGITEPQGETWIAGLNRHAQMYGHELPELLERFGQRLDAAREPATRERMIVDLQQWLPHVDELFLAGCLDDAHAVLDNVREAVEHELSQDSEDCPDDEPGASFDVPRG
jgi:predicted nucleotidyltransferase component of viral defense system